MNSDDLRGLPAVHRVLASERLAALVAGRGRQAVVDAVRAELADLRARLQRGEHLHRDADEIARGAAWRLREQHPALRAVINATGVILHTGLGRAPLAAEAVAAVASLARGYGSLELDLESGQRGHRAQGVSTLLARLTGAEAAAVVNNNAAATILVLRALAAGREVVVSRGQLVEIGGSFRLPEIFEASGARLREVGTTNRTRLADYERAIGPDTAALLRVHPSNYRVEGFTESVPIGDLAALGRARGLPVLDDIGSGALGPERPAGVPGEPTAAESLAAGADVVLFSGDKLLGGPQCGLILGRGDLVTRMTADPLMRALRVDKMTLAALEATLRLAADPVLAAHRIPVWRMLRPDPDTLQARAAEAVGRLQHEWRVPATACPAPAVVGGGSLPRAQLPSWAVVVGEDALRADRTIVEVARRLRTGDPAVVGTVQNRALHLNMLTVQPDQDEPMLDAVGRAVQEPL